jgi:hypothetical protein
MVDGDQQSGGEEEADAIDSLHLGAIPWMRKEKETRQSSRASHWSSG